MKKTHLFLLCITVLMLLFQSCNGPLRREMLSYYEQNEKYVEAEGTIVSIAPSKQYDAIYIKIEYADENSPLPCEPGETYGLFMLPCWSAQNFELNEGDVIVFTSAPDHFYNGHRLPIVHIEKDGEELLSFETGKENYIKWINETFD